MFHVWHMRQREGIERLGQAPSSSERAFRARHVVCSGSVCVRWVLVGVGRSLITGVARDRDEKVSDLRADRSSAPA